MAAVTHWVRRNHFKVAAIGIGVAAAFGVVYSLWSSKKSADSSQKVTSEKIAEFLAKKWMDKIELQDGKIRNDDLASIIMTIRSDCNEKIKKLRDELKHEEEELARTDAVVYA
jgi:hypothetical protein